jgi:hypothetical protein
MPYDTKTFYVRVERDNTHIGYIDYPFAEGKIMVGYNLSSSSHYTMLSP